MGVNPPSPSGRASGAPGLGPFGVAGHGSPVARKDTNRGVKLRRVVVGSYSSGFKRRVTESAPALLETQAIDKCSRELDCHDMTIKLERHWCASQTGDLPREAVALRCPHNNR